MSSRSITNTRAQIQSGDLKPADLIKELADQIEARDNGDNGIGAYLSHNLHDAFKAADSLSDEELAKPLGGIPIAIKDNINVKGEPCTCASQLLAKNYTSPYDATVIKKLKNAGAIPFGRCNMDEFAMGSSTENSSFKKTLNPKNPTHIPGGSSGGSAAAVGADMAIAALGSDTGGSIRQPASHCGVVGLKPSYGRVSRYGLVAFASSLDQIGPLTHTVDDAALILQTIAGPDKDDERDSTCLDQPVPDYLSTINDGVDGMTLGLPKQYFGEGLDPRINEIITKSAENLEKQGAKIVEVDLPNTQHAVATYYILAPAEASSNLSRFDGIRYGNRTEDPEDLIDLYRKTRANGFGPEVKRRIILGTYVLSSGYYDAYYSRAQKVRTLIQQDFATAFNGVDALLSPVSPTPPRALTGGATQADPLADYLADIYTISANLAGISAISVPAGTVDSDQGGNPLPIGLQITAPHMGEQRLLKIAKTHEATFS